jgi:dihydrofolate synthase/folylpolyglutamate synthase
MVFALLKTLHQQSVSKFLFFFSMSVGLALAKVIGGGNCGNKQLGRVVRSLSLSSSTTGDVSYVPNTPGDQEYQSTLVSMFRAVKNPSRHKVDKGQQAQKSNHDLFRERKEFYNELAREGGSWKHSPSTAVIHVAGTKGKGSVVEYVGAGLRKSSKVGVFTSPHLHTARERIKVGTKLISKEDLVRLGKESIQRMVDVPWAVFFDLFLATAIQYFDEHAQQHQGGGGLDYIILETGIGGRYDSTNFVEQPKVGIITSLSLDHQNVLGDTLDLIAWQKAGIVKAGMHIFTPSTQSEVALHVIRKACDEQGATLHVVDVSRDTCVQQIGITPRYDDIEVQNLCLSHAVLRHLQVQDLSGMKDFFWPCRMEKFEVNGVTIILDGCHNGDSMQLFLKGVQNNYPGRKLRVLFGGGIEKSLEDMMLQVYTYADSVVYLQSSHFKSASERELCVAMNNAGYDIAMPLGCAPLDRIEGGTVSRRVAEALVVPSSGKESDRPVVVVCGSLFAAAEAREALFRTQPGLFSADDWVREGDF